MKTIKCYSKFCVRNSYGPRWLLVEKWAKEHGFDDVDVYRTIYDLDWHKEAASISGREDYLPFLVYRGKVKLISEIIREMENKNDVHTATIKKSTKKATRKASNRKAKKEDRKVNG